MEHIPYNGLAPALLDIASGRVHVIFGLESAALLKNPKIKVLSTGAKNRNPALPAVPTVAESGLAQLEQIRGWNGVHAPKGTPKAIIDKLNSEIQKAIATPEVKDRLLSAGFTPQTGSVESFSIFVREDMERWEKVVADTGAKPE